MGKHLTYINKDFSSQYLRKTAQNISFICFTNRRAIDSIPEMTWCFRAWCNRFVWQFAKKNGKSFVRDLIIDNWLIDYTLPFSLSFPIEYFS